jgi:hypothetical protein
MEPIEKRSTLEDYNNILDKPLSAWPETKAKQPPSSYLQRFIPTSGASILTFIAHGTTPFITTFILVHLTAPIAANLGGSSLASQVMVSSQGLHALFSLLTCAQLLGREYYQTPVSPYFKEMECFAHSTVQAGEKFLVNIPILAHVGASILKRVIPSCSRSKSNIPTPEGKLASLPPRPLRSLLAWSGYASVVLTLGIHYPLHRLAPQSAAAEAFGPAQLDMEFVKTGLQQWPIRSWLLYSGLVAATLLHTADGLFVIALYQRIRAKSRQTWRTVGALATVPALTGLYVMRKEPVIASSGLVKNFIAAFKEAHVYRL